MLDLSLPSGLRDLLPDHSAHLAELSAKLQEVFSRFGYRRVFLPTLERLDVVERGLSAAALADVMKFVEPGSGEVVAIRPDITPQIARLYAARPDALPSPARLCYDGPVLRAREARAGRPREVYQAGVELLGAGGPSADAEALVVLARALERVGLGAAVLEVGHARFAHAVIDGAGLAPKGRAAAWEALSRKDEDALAALAKKGRGEAAARAALPELATLYGDGALSRARKLVRDVPGAATSLGQVEAALKIARRRGVKDVSVDLGETRGLGYYTGITFAGYAPGAGSAVAAGGRYDELLERFGRPGPAIGFAVDLEFATQALERANGRAGERTARSRRSRPR
ncbi:MULTISPECIES: ATP phosphoribosyltransferase regulatory subunit [unclassified Anaeromyxobacter]|uniref:ATP phosphoribosyltransferase regulatory subunit n=1 Tax=unclassified Anaeromyxobacter TaxID=2620896 RepID=UPI001F59EB1D|nr:MULTISPECIES: ATP phosphoribosyltransferase regulatory subunit [unclassified Anaeromyxobacter]